MRTRSKQTTFTTTTNTTTETYSSGLSPISWTWTAYELNPSYESIMVDEVNNNRRFNSCLHTTKHTVPVEVWATVERSPGVFYTSEGYALFNRAIRVPGVPVAIEWYPTGLSNETMDALNSSAVRHMVPSFKEENSLVNFILELKDLKRIPDLWSKRRTFLKNVANAHLNYSFGIAPLVSDVTNLVSSLSGFKRKLEALRAGSGKELVRHFRHTINFPDLPGRTVLYSEGGTAYQVVRTTKWLKRPVYSASMRMRYEMPDISTEVSRLKALLDVLGVRPDASIVWNAIPFSFLVDWFSRVGDYLGELSSDNLQIPVTITDFCHSVKYVVQNTLWDEDYGHKRIVSTTTIESYDRRRAIPLFGVPQLRDSDLDSREALLGLSLFVANS